MAKQLLVELETGEQVVISLDDTGDYNFKSKILWDTSKKGPLPQDIELGKMAVGGDGSLVKLAEAKPEHLAAIAKKDESRLFVAIDFLRGNIWYVAAVKEFGLAMPTGLQQAMQAAADVVLEFENKG